jgi:phenylacetate-CoA ligase
MKHALSLKNLWNATPEGVKKILGPGLKLVPLPLLLGSRFRRNVKFISAAESWSYEQIAGYQLDRLRSIITLAYEKTAYYRQVFDSIGFQPGDLKSIDDLRRLPLTDKSTIRDHLHEMLARRADHPSVDKGSTGGTGGQPLVFYMGKERSAIEYAYLMVSWQRIGYQLGTPLAVFRGHVVRPDRNGFHHRYDPLLRQHVYSNYHLTEENMHRYIHHLRSIGPCYLHIYPSAGDTLARFISRNKLEPPANILGIIAESEIVYPEQRKRIEAVFRRRLFSLYGHSEKLVFASECEHSSFYHVWPTYGYCELIDPAGHPVTTHGERGEIVGTGFINTVLPFIRYRTGDFATHVADHCEACGRRHLLLADIRGHRIQETLIAADGAEISWTALNMHDDTFDNVRQFQFYQDTPGRGILRIVPAGPFDEEDRRRICRNFGKKFDGRFHFEIELRESIPLSPRGKAIFVDQHIPS